VSWVGLAIVAGYVLLVEVRLGILRSRARSLELALQTLARALGRKAPR
jgi:uncharacterized protein YigA (DUF484 family)